jgi:WD40 repeat protein
MSISSSPRDDSRFEQLAEEFAERHRRGERPSLQEYIDRLPKMAEAFREMFPNLVEVERVEGDARENARRPSPAVPPLRQIGDYRLVREVGRGGMGVVYQAEQVSLGRRVALKVLSRQASGDRRILERFRREARAAARLHHTNIVPVYEVGQDGDLCFYAMQFIQGPGLDAVIAELRRLRDRSGSEPPVGAASEGPSLRPRREHSGQADQTPTHSEGVEVGQVLRSILTSRFDPGGRDSETVGDSRPTPPRALAGGLEIPTRYGTERRGAESGAAPTGIETESSTDDDTIGPEGAVSREPASPSSASPWSNSAILPGSTQLSLVESTGRGLFRSLAQIGRQVAGGLAYAHARGIVHRDIKPSNLLLDAEGVAWITDFGVAKGDDEALTHTGDILGTIRYMAPERFRGEGDARADVYALGLTLYELLTLRPGFESPDRLRLIEQIKAEEPRKPRSIDARIPRDLETIVLKAIEKDPRARYQSAEAMGEDLGRFLADEPIRARQVGAAERYWRWARRNPVIAILGGVLTAVLTVGCFVMALLWSRAENSASIARSNELKAQALATTEAAARGEAQALAAEEAKARGEAEVQERLALEKAELLAREDYVNRVNRAYREVQDDNVALAEDLLHGCPPERRGWEWHFVERLCNTERLTLDLGHTSVNALAFGPDGTWAVSGSGALIIGAGVTEEATTIRIWDVSSGRRRSTLPGAKGTVYEVAVSPDGKRVAAGFSAGLVMVWDASTGRVAWTRGEPGWNAMSVTFSPDGGSLAVGYGVYSGDRVGRVKVWGVASGKEMQVLGGPRGGVNKVAFHPDGRRLAVAGSGVVEIWDLQTASKLLDLKGHRKWVYCVAYSPDGRWLATGGWDNTVKLRDAATGFEAQTIFAHEGFVLGLAFSPDSRLLATASEDRSVRLWEVPSGRASATFHGHTDFVQAVTFRPDGREVGTGSLDGSIRFWDLRTSRPVVVEHDGWVDRIAFRRDGLRVLSRAASGGKDVVRTRGWDPVGGEPDPELAGVNFEALPAEFLPDSGPEPRGVRSPDGRLIAQMNALMVGIGPRRSKEYSINAIIVREAASGRVIHTLTGHTADVTYLAFSPDGRRLASASFDRTIKLWDMQSGQLVFTLLGHTAGVVSLAFSADGNQIASGGIDGTARVWNAAPIATEVIAGHDARYRKNVETLARLRATTDDAQRAELLAASGQWAEAAEAFARAVEKEPDKLRVRYRLIDALVKLGNRRLIGPACDEMVKRFGDAGDPLQALGVAGLCRLAPQAIADPEKRRAVHEMAMASDDVGRAGILAKYGQWDLVGNALAKHVEDHPDDLGYRQWHLLSLLELGDIPGYRAAAGGLVSRYRKASDPNALNAARWCTYIPDAVADPTVPVRMTEAALALYGADQKRFALSALGATLYRAGRIDEAIVRLDESVKASDGVGVPQDWVFLAMAHHKRGSRDEARRWLRKARDYVKDEKTVFSNSLVETRFLLKEAEALLREDPPARPEPGRAGGQPPRSVEYESPTRVRLEKP